MNALTGKRILIFVDELYEDLELWYPKLRLMEEGAEIIVAGPVAGEVYSGKKGYPCKAETALNSVVSEDYHGLVIPGGFAPDKLRRIPKVLEITRAVNEAGKLVAHICHAGWVPISAGIMKDRSCTSVVAIRDDLMNAGANWVDEPVVVDRNMISSRGPDDLPLFCRAIIEFLSHG